jgi:hypothetical protein
MYDEAIKKYKHQAQISLSKANSLKQGVAEGSLNEFASGGSGGNGPFDYGSAIVQIGQDYTETFNDDGDGADAARIIRVGKTFMSKGMSAGIKAFYAMDSFVRDHVAEELSNQGFNVKQDIYAPYQQQMAKAKADTDKYRSSPEYAASRADDLKISAIPEKPIDSWSKPGDPAASVSMDNASKRDVKAEFEKFKQDVAQRNSLKGVPLKFVVTVGGKPVDIDKLSEQGVAGRMLPKSSFAGSDKHKLGPAAHAKGKQKGPVKKGQFVGGMEEAKKKGADGKACWKGYRYAGTKNGKDKCVPVGEDVENIMGAQIENLIRK